MSQLDDDLNEDDLSEWAEISRSGINTASTIHDRFQFESTFEFDLQPQAEETHKRYEIDVYFFLPRSMGVNSNNYNRDHFYGDLTHYLRIRTPQVEKWSRFKQHEWIIASADRYFEYHLFTRQRQALIDFVVEEVKLFGCFANTQLKRIRAHMIRLTQKKQSDLSRRAHVLRRRLESLCQMIHMFRQRYLQPIKQNHVLTDPEVRKVFLLVDEYLSYRLEVSLIHCVQLLNTHELDLPQLNEHFHAILTDEIAYRSSEGVVNLENSQHAALREAYYYRLGLLKKYISDVLYVQLQNVQKDKAYRNLVAASGAALAATWATLTDIQRLRLTADGGLDSMGFRLLIIVLLGVIAYVFKDRIKELSKEYFNEKLKHYLPDFEYQMFYNHFSLNTYQKETIKVGGAKEFMRYLKKGALSPEVLYLRELGHVADVEPERLEEIIHYSKKMTFDIESVQDHLSQVRFIKDIVRFDISDFLAKLDDPNKNLRYFDREKGICMIEAPKVYHLNVLFRYSLSHRQGNQWQSRKIEFERVRIILNKRGIVRIEQVLPRGEMRYDEAES